MLVLATNRLVFLLDQFVRSVFFLLDQFVSSFDRSNGLSIFHFDAVRFIDFSAKDFDPWVQWIRDSCFGFNF